MSMTYAQLKQAIQDYTQNDEATFVTNIPNFVRQCEEIVYTSVQLSVLRKNQTGTLTASNRYLTLPSDFIAPYSLLVTASGTTQTALLFKDEEWLREAFPDPTVTGTPKYYAMFDSTTFLVAPTPTGSYAVEMHYFYYPESIVTASTTWLGTNFDQVLLWGSLVNAYLFMKGEKDLIDSYDGQFKQGLSMLKKLGDGMLRQDTFKALQTKTVVT